MNVVLCWLLILVDFVARNFYFLFSLTHFFRNFFFFLLVQEVVLKDSPNETKDPEGGCAC